MRNFACFGSQIVVRVLFTVILALGGACGSARAQDLPLVRVGTSSNDASAVIYFAQDRGFFNRAGIRVEIEPDSNGAAVATAVLSGALDVGVSNVVSIALAHSKNLPLAFIAPSAIYSSTAPTTVLMAEKKSPISSGSSLSGKIVAVDGLNNITQVAAQGWIDTHGGDSRTVRFVELPFSEMGSALQRHVVDAAVIAEPALTAAKSHARVIGNPLDSIGHHFLINAWFANTTWIAKNPDVVKRFAYAMSNAAKWANDHRGQSALILIAHSRIPAQVVAKMTRATYAETLDPSLIQPEIDAAVKYGIIKETFSASELIYGATSREEVL
jgi:NitT/TauT family transport system substrate-binding protein